MRFYLPLVLSAVTLVADPPPKDLDAIQGTWDVSRIERNGKPQPRDPLFRIKVIFDGDKILAKVGSRQPEPRGTIKLDQGRDPKAYDLLTPEGTAVRGIYVLDGDTLKVCLSAPGDERPTTLATTPDDDRTLIVYRREKPSGGR